MSRGAGLCLLSVMILAGVPRAAGATRPADFTLNLIVPRYLVAGGEAAWVHAQLLDAEGLPVPDGTSVTFSASLGARFEPVTAASVDGLAATRMTPGTEAGFASVDAISGESRGNVVMWVRPAPAAHVLWLEARPDHLEPGHMAQIEASLTDAYGNEAEADPVVWSAGGGTVEPVTGVVEHGRARAVFTASGERGSAWVHLQTDGPGARVAIPVAPMDRTALVWTAFLPWMSWREGATR